MNKIRKWFNKPKKEIEKPLMIRPLTPERTHRAPHDITVIMEMLSSSPQRLAALLLDLRYVDGGLIGPTRKDGPNPDLILTTRLSMLREMLQGARRQEPEVSDVPRTSAPLPVWNSLLQVKQLTGNRMKAEPSNTGSSDIVSHSPAVGGATNTLATTPGLPVRSLLKVRDACSLPSSPHLGGRTRPACSLPCSPLLGGTRWRPSPSSPSRLSRFWVEEALQRSKNPHQSEPRPPQQCHTQVRQEGEEEGVRSRQRETEEEGMQEQWSDEEEDHQVRPVSTVGIRLSDTVIFRPTTAPSTCGGEEEDSQLMCVDWDMWRYCLLTPCVCLRCPSAPPYEDELFSVAEFQTVSSFSSKDEKQCLIQRTDVQRTDGGSELSKPRDTALQLGESSCLYPSLSLWRISPVCQTELDRKEEQEVIFFDSRLDPKPTQSNYHGNNTDDHLLRLCKTISCVADELQTLCCVDLSFILKVFDSTTCTERTVCSVESCSFCSDTLMTHLCRNCAQVFCSRCLCLFVSLYQIHQFSQTEV